MLLARIAGLTLLLATACSDNDPHVKKPTEGATIETITTVDGIALDARLFAAADGRLVVLLHRFSEDQRSWFYFARDLQALGLSALTLDFRGHGSSTGKKNPGLIDRDVRAALAFAREHGFDRVVLVDAPDDRQFARLVVADGDTGATAKVEIVEWDVNSPLIGNHKFNRLNRSLVAHMRPGSGMRKVHRKRATIDRK